MLGLRTLTTLIPFLSLTFAAPASLKPRQNTTTSSIGDVKVNNVVTPELRASLQQQLDFWRIPGAVIAVYAPDAGYEGVEVFGKKDFEGNDMDGDTYLAIASNSKWVTALALATLETWGNITLQNGEIFTLDSRIKDIWPEFEMVEANATDKATVADFLTMVSGVPRHDLSIGRGESWTEALRKFSVLKPSAPYGTPVQQYATIHYNALSVLPELLIGHTLDQFVEKQIWAELGITATFNATWAGETGRRGQGFNSIQNYTGCAADLNAGQLYNESANCRGQLDGFDFWTEGDGMEQGGGGAILMTGKDLYKWVKESIDPSVIPKEALDIAYTRYNVTVGENIRYGLGVNQAISSGSYFHGGALPGHNSAFHRDLEKNVGVFVIVNLDPQGYYIADGLAAYTLQALAGEEPTDLTPLLLQTIMGPYGYVPSNSTGGGNGTETEGGSERDVEEQSGSADPASGTPGTGVTLPPANPRPIPEGIEVAGTYLAPGYQSVTFSPINLTNLEELDAANISLDAISFIGQAINLSTPSWFGTWDGSFTTHFMLFHFDGLAFNYTALTSFPKLGEWTDENTPNTTWTPGLAEGSTIKYFGAGPAVFAPADADAEGDQPAGFGTFGTWWGNDALVQPNYTETDVFASSAAFFVRQ